MIDLGQNEIEVQKEELSHWLNLPITGEFRRRLVALFDHQGALLGAQPGASVDRYLGRAEVLEHVLNPSRLFEE